MTTDELRAAIVRNLRKVAPEADAATLDPTVPFRDQIDLDSMDYFNFVLGLHKELQVEIPEGDYQKLISLQSCIEYLAGKVR
ncbi:MAG TPA: phosphopantetheine-binding protein [Gemmatales bacterium]|nr:phosphopantetheine-binding protein [Gemmatales bacterium]